MLVEKILKLCLMIFVFMYSSFIYPATTASSADSSINNNQPLQPFTVILDWFANPDHAPLFVAQQQGFFKQQGLDVKLIGPADPSDPPKLVAAGKADLAITYQPQLLIDVQQGLPLVRVATLIDKPLGCMAVKADNGINSIANLKGKTIGYSVSGVDSVMLHTMLTAHGLSIHDVKLINVNYDLTQALMTGRVDAVTGIFRNFELIQMKLAGFHAQAFYPEDNGVPQFDELILVANRNELTDPRLPRFIKALTQGEAYLQQHPQQSWQLFAHNHPELNNELNHQAWFISLPDFAKDPSRFSVEKYDFFARYMLKEGLITRFIPVSDYAIKLGV